MDFEEGEVDSASESESERSVLPVTESTKITKKHDRSNHSRHRAKRVVPKASDSSFSRDGRRSFKPNGHSELATPEETAGLKLRHGHLSLKDYLSEDEDSHIPRPSRRHDKHSNSEQRPRKRRRKVERFIKPVVRIQCRYFMEGRCSKGDSCPFAHDFEPPKKQELCKFYAVGVCSKGSNCVYLHSEFPCKFFHLSGRCNHGDSCKFSHDRLTPETKTRLDSATGTWEFSSASGHAYPSDRPSRPTGVFPGFGEHGDVDYRFGRRPQFGQPANPRDFGPQSPRPSYPDFDAARSSISDNYRESRNLLGPRPPFEFHPGVIPTHCPEDSFHPNVPIRHGFAPPRFALGGPPNGPYSPGFRPPERALLRPPMNHRTMIRPLDLLGHPDFPPCRPLLCPPTMPIPTPPFNPTPILPSTDIFVSSELDKMAALLASSKPPPSTCLASPDVHTQSPAVPSTVEKPADTLLSPTTTAEVRTPSSESSNISVRKSSVPQSSPEVNVVTSEPHSVIGSPPSTTWRLIQLDMNVKIPYPLMQLSIEDLPHRFEDPRLRGQLTTLRPQAKPTSSITLNDLSLSTLGSEVPIESTAAEAEKTSTPKRRPIKLQLNEMASTFANVQSAVASHPATKSGDRSYLDDPRFRRRRIIATTSSSQIPSLSNDTSLVTTESLSPIQLP